MTPESSSSNDISAELLIIDLAEACQTLFIATILDGYGGFEGLDAPRETGADVQVKRIAIDRSLNLRNRVLGTQVLDDGGLALLG